MNEHQIFAIQRFWDWKESWEYHMTYGNKHAARDAGWRMASAAGDCKILHAFVDDPIPRIPRVHEALALGRQGRSRK